MQQLKNRKKGHKKYSAKKRKEHILTEKAVNWIAIDFVNDSIANKRALKNLTVIDPVSKVAPRIFPALSMQGEGVAQVLDEIRNEEKFKFLQTDNGPKFRSSAVQTWCIDHDVKQVNIFQRHPINIFISCNYKISSILSRIISSAGNGQVLRLAYEFLLRNNIAILSNINSSAGNQLTERRVSAVSHFAFSCSSSFSSPETMVQRIQCIVR